MSADFAHDSHQHVIERQATRSLRARVVLALGPAAVLVGVAWAVIQPYRLTILHPHGQGFWWLVSQPPLYVVLAGVVFRLVVAPGLARDLRRLDEHDQMSSGRVGRRETASSVASIEPLSTLSASLSRGRPTRPADGATAVEAS